MFAQTHKRGHKMPPWKNSVLYLERNYSTSSSFQKILYVIQMTLGSDLIVLVYSDCCHH